MAPEKENVIVKKTYQFSLAIIEYTELLEGKQRYSMAKQLFKSGTSIGANVREAQSAESRVDFRHKMKIAAKEAEETHYWLDLCKDAPNYPNPGILLDVLTTIQKILSKIISSSYLNA